ncbi:hypothetical protein AB0L57_08385 [Nocardia sp. NPDC052254]|uniref:hypothetical protein n=1 Tax=Nocardia sp. NPDC052254 TaxID=3155681 RepID=UPI003433FE90
MTSSGPSAALRPSAADHIRAWAGLLLAALPSAAVLTVLLYGLGLAMDFSIPGILAIVWLVICVAAATGCFLGAGQRRLAGALGIRPPDHDEQPVLWAAWQRVAGRAGVPAGAYSLWVRTDGRELALPHRMIAVSDVTELPPAEVEAVLAQALGGHFHSRTALCQLVFRLYNLPLVGLERILLSGPATAGAWLTRQLSPGAARPVGMGWNAISRILVACPVIAASTVIVGLPAAVALRVAPEVAACALVPIARRIEFGADRVAVDLGYGPDLGAALWNRALRVQESAALYALSVSAWSPHPAPDERVRHIRDRLDELARAGYPPR